MFFYGVGNLLQKLVRITFFNHACGGGQRLGYVTDRKAGTHIAQIHRHNFHTLTPLVAIFLTTFIIPCYNANIKMIYRNCR
jgi:hypothetical protein